MEQEDIRLGFLVVHELGSEQVLRGVVLVTDGYTHPVEIRYSGVYEVTKLEKIAFGLKLKEGVAISKIGAPLLQSLTEQPHVILVDDPDIVRVQKFSSSPVVHVEPSEIESKEITSEDDLKYNFYSDDPTLVQRFNELVNGLDEKIELYEPLTRAQKALEYIHYDEESDFD